MTKLTRDEEKRSWIATLLARPYRLLPMRARSLARRLVAAVEGGEMRSATLRDMLRRHHRIDVGLHSYGCFDPVRFPDCRFGRYVSVGPGVRVFRRNHPVERLSLHPYFFNASLGLCQSDSIEGKPLVIEDDVWIGAGSMLLPGCSRIGRGAVIGAGSVVTRDVPAYAVAAGNPARLIRERFPRSLQDAVQDSGWWDRPTAELTAALPLLQQPLTAETMSQFTERMQNANQQV